MRLHIDGGKLWLPDRNVGAILPRGVSGEPIMRKLLWLSIVAIVPACGCQCITEPLRRIEVWKLQAFAPVQPVTIAPPGGVCGQAPVPESSCGQMAESGCGAPMGASTITGYGPETVTGETSDEVLPGPILTEESDSVLKQP